MRTKEKTPVSPLAQLEQLREEARAAQVRAAAADAKRTQSSRWLPAAQAKLAGYLTAVVDGSRKRDPNLERELRDDVTDLEAMRVQTARRGDSTIYTDRRTIAGHEDAVLAEQDATGAVVAFIVEHRAELETEMSARSIDARDQLLAAVDQLSAALAKWQATSRDWRELIARWPDLSPGEIPLSPLPGTAVADIELVAAQIRGGARDPRGALPMPLSLAPGAAPDDQATSPGSLRGCANVPRVISSQAGVLGA